MDSYTVKKLAQEVGFDVCGITTAAPPAEAERQLTAWVQSGKHGGMKYLEQFSARAENLRQQFPEANSIIVLGLNYFSYDNGHCEGAKRLKQTRTEIASSALRPPHNDPFERLRVMVSKSTHDNAVGRVARYAWGRDYHFVIKEKIEALTWRIRESSSREIQFEDAIDTKPILERPLAERAGLGLIGKQTQLLSPEFGPWLFLAELITDLELEPDQPFRAPLRVFHKGTCGSCRRCIDRCPAGAIEERGGIDARKCIAYLTIESKGAIPVEFREKMGNRVFGCDECLEACPYTSKQKETACEDLKASAGAGSVLDLEKLFDLKNESEYRSAFRGSAILRSKRAQLLRNACVVLGNSRQKSALRVLRQAREDSSPLVREHADWALCQLSK